MRKEWLFSNFGRGGGPCSHVTKVTHFGSYTKHIETQWAENKKVANLKFSKTFRDFKILVTIYKFRKFDFFFFGFWVFLDFDFWIMDPILYVEIKEINKAMQSVD